MNIEKFLKRQEARFWKQVAFNPGGCWLWKGRTDKEGYGSVFFKRRISLAHRVMWELEHGPIPPALTIDHLCRERLCVNPLHFDLVTHRENVLRGIGFAAINSRKTVCPSGHPYDEVNTAINSVGARVCKICKRKNYNAWAARQRARISSRCVNMVL